MNFEQFSYGSSFLHQLDTRAKFVSCLILVMILALSRTFAAAASGLLLGLLLVLLARLPIRMVVKRLLLVNAFVGFLWVTLPLSYPGDILFSLGPLSISLQGLLLAGLISLKANGVFLLIMALIATSSVADLGHALERLHVPLKLCLLLLFSYRYIFVISQEYQRLLRAARVRCFKPTTNMHTYRTFGYLFGMTLIKSLHRGDRVRKAMLLRGFQGRFHSLYQARFGTSEICFCAAAMGAAAGLIWVESLLS